MLPQQWEAPLGVVVSPSNAITSDFVPGVPSATNPRRMIASYASLTGFVEGNEDIDLWTFTALPFPGFTFTRDPFLSSDGLALLFVGDRGQGIQIYRATRTSIDLSFDPPVALHDITTGGGDEHTPALSPDCQTLYWTNDDNNTFSTKD